MSKIKLALVGCGGIAKSHVARFECVKDRMDLVAAVDVDIEKAEAVADLIPGAKVSTDYREVLDDADALLLALPHQLHHSIAMDCLAADKHVLLEKPMANTEQECLDLIAADAKSDKTLMIAYCMRFHPIVLKMKELIDNKTYGDVFQVSIFTEQHTEFHPPHWVASAEKLGGGQFFSHGCHYVDMMLDFLGRPVRGSHHGTNLGTPWMEKEGTSNVTIEFESGAMGYHFGTWGARGSRLKGSYHAHCTEGMLEAAISQGKLIYHRDDKEEVLLEMEAGKHTENEMVHFLDCIESGEKPLTDPVSSLEGLQVIWKLYEAEAANKLADLRGMGFGTHV